MIISIQSGVGSEMVAKADAGARTQCVGRGRSDQGSDGRPSLGADTRDWARTYCRGADGWARTQGRGADATYRPTQT